MDLEEGSSHDVVVDEEAGYAVAVGSRPVTTGAAAAARLLRHLGPSDPSRSGCDGADGYTRDAQCLRLPARVFPSERFVAVMVYGYNRDSLTIYDVADRVNSTILSITSYEGAAYPGSVGQGVAAVPGHRRRD